MPNIIAPRPQKPAKYKAPVTMPGRDANATLVLLGLHPMGVCAEHEDFVSLAIRSQISVSSRKLSTLFGVPRSIDDQNLFWVVPGCGKVFLHSTRKPRTCMVSFNKNFHA